MAVKDIAIELGVTYQRVWNYFKELKTKDTKQEKREEDEEESGDSGEEEEGHDFEIEGEAETKHKKITVKKKSCPVCDSSLEKVKIVDEDYEEFYYAYECQGCGRLFVDD